MIVELVTKARVLRAWPWGDTGVWPIPPSLFCCLPWDEWLPLSLPPYRPRTNRLWTGAPGTMKWNKPLLSLTGLMQFVNPLESQPTQRAGHKQCPGFGGERQLSVWFINILMGLWMRLKHRFCVIIAVYVNSGFMLMTIPRHGSLGWLLGISVHVTSQVHREARQLFLQSWVHFFHIIQ